MDSFPGLLFALATGYATQEQRNQAFAIIHNGGPLRTACETLNLPWWLRRLPAEAYTEPLIDLPLDPDFARHIIQFVPTNAKEAPVWLWGVLYGNRACHSSFALWAASWLSRHHRILTAPQGENTFRYMTAWAWHADKPDTPGHQLLRRKWNPAMGLRRSVDELGNWRRRIALAYAIANISDDKWIREGEVLGLEFVLLRSPRDFIEESDRMDNCLDQFAERLQQHRSHVFSVRRNGRCIANVEIGSHELEPAMPAVLQLRGPRNKRAAAEVWQATYAWLGMQPFRVRNNLPNPNAINQARETAIRFWAPYLQALEKTELAPKFRELVLGARWGHKRPTARRADDNVSRVASRPVASSR